MGLGKSSSEYNSFLPSNIPAVLMYKRGMLRLFDIWTAYLT